jgi:hypothetical protein
MTRAQKWSQFSLLTLFAAALTAGCVQQEDKKEEPPPAPAPPPAPPPEPARVTLSVDANAPVTFTTPAGDKCLQFAGGSKNDLARAEIAACNGSPAQQFKLGSTPGGYFTLVSVASNKCLDVSAFNMGDGALLQQFGCNGGANQNWIVADGGGGTVRLVARHSGKVLEVTDGVTAGGVVVSTGTWKSAPTQQFKLKGKSLVADGAGGKSGSDGAGGTKGSKSKKAKKAKETAAAAP